MKNQISKTLELARYVLHVLKLDVGDYESAILNYRNAASLIKTPPAKFKETVLDGMEKLMRAMTKVGDSADNEREVQDAINQVESYEDFNWGAEASITIRIELNSMPPEFAKAVCDELESAVKAAAEASDFLDSVEGKGVYNETKAYARIKHGSGVVDV